MEQAASPCDICHSRSARYSLVDAGERVAACLRCFLLAGSVVRRAVVTALVVGTVLTAIHQGDALLGGDVSAALAWKIPLTYAVPYAVTTWGTVGGAREQRVER